jgi:hypothetical protein
MQYFREKAGNRIKSHTPRVKPSRGQRDAFNPDFVHLLNDEQKMARATKKREHQEKERRVATARNIERGKKYFVDRQEIPLLQSDDRITVRDFRYRQRFMTWLEENTIDVSSDADSQSSSANRVPDTWPRFPEERIAQIVRTEKRLGLSGKWYDVEEYLAPESTKYGEYHNYNHSLM